MAILAMLLVIFVSNLAALIGANMLGVFRPYINADYLLVAFLFVLGFRFWGWAALALVFFVDILNLVGQLFPVARISDAAYLLGFIGIAPLKYKVALLILVLWLAIKGTLFTTLSRLKDKAPALLIINILLLFYISSFVVDQGSYGRLWRLNGFEYIGSQLQYRWTTYNDGLFESLRSEDVSVYPIKNSASAPWHDRPDLLADKVLLVVVESWGKTRPDIHEAVTKPLSKASDRISSYESGWLGFGGVTVEAELRELCRLSATNFNLAKVDKGFEQCLPNVLKARGYRTVAVHGASGVMYGRAEWYPRMGFESKVFFESDIWERRCYSFPGACDYEMARKISDFFQAEGKGFAYWLTLNSHIFYDERDIVRDVLDCGDIGVPDGSQTCRNLKLQAQFFDVLAELALDPKMAGSEILVVGDHTPPILDESGGDSFFEDGEVPWIKFKVTE